MQVAEGTTPELKKQSNNTYDAVQGGTGTARPSELVQALQDITFGSFAGIIGKYVEYPFDTVKVRLQSQPDGRPPLYSGPLDCFRQSINSEGLSSLYRGVSAPLVGAAIENSCLFLSYRICQGILLKSFFASEGSEDTLPLEALAVAGAGSGAFTSLVLTPVELIKCKMQVPSATGVVSTRVGPFNTIATIFKHRGLFGFWHGQLGTLIRETGGSAAWFGSYEGVGLTFKRRNEARGQPEGHITVPQQLAAGAAAGIAYNISFYPADTIKSRMQTEDVSSTALEKQRRRTFWTVGRDLWREHGIRGLYRGCGITALRAAPSSALVFTIYEGLKNHFR